jgi:hypothetical protein
MRAVDIGISHDDDLVVAQLRDVEVISVAFREAAAETVDHRLDLGIGQDLVDAGLLDIQNLAADRQDGLVIAVAGRLGRAAGGISLDDENLASGRIAALAVRELSVAVK